jgi:hypothetical protein
MKTTMDMSSYEIELDEMEMEYGEKLMSADWVPANEFELDCGLQVMETSTDVSTASEIGLRKMYSYQH